MQHLSRRRNDKLYFEFPASFLNEHHSILTCSQCCAHHEGESKQRSHRREEKAHTDRFFPLPAPFLPYLYDFSSPSSSLLQRKTGAHLRPMQQRVISRFRVMMREGRGTPIRSLEREVSNSTGWRLERIFRLTWMNTFHILLAMRNMHAWDLWVNEILSVNVSFTLVIRTTDSEWWWDGRRRRGTLSELGSWIQHCFRGNWVSQVANEMFHNPWFLIIQETSVLHLVLICIQL